MSMDVVVAGGHGQIGLRLLRLLAGGGHRGRGIVRAQAQSHDLEAVGAEALVCDLEREDLVGRLDEADAVVFAAGAGPGSGPERKRTVDYGAAVKLIEAARTDGVRRYVMVSSIGAADPEAGPEQMQPYLRAKADADEALANSGLDHTIVRPGRLTDQPGTGLVAAGEQLGRRDEISRDDVAAVLLAVLGADNTIGKTFELLGGGTPVEEAVQAL
jgi:nucleoside-diphosphate-sugar epimerase